MVDMPPGLEKSVAAAAISLLDNAFSYLGGGPGGGEVDKANLSQILHLTLEHQACRDGYRLRSLDGDYWKFREIVEEVEDAINDIEYKDWSHRLEEEVRKLISKFVKTKIINKVARFVLPNHLQRLSTAIRKLEEAARDHFFQAYHVDSADAHQHYGLRRATSVPGGEGVFGRDKEKEQIVQWLTKEPQVVSSTSPVSIFAIVGMAGMGKTTLAQLVRQDLDVLTNFHLVIWVPHAVYLRPESITTEILRSIGFPARSSIESMQDYVEQKFRAKKILLILDDVWEDESTENWANLVSLLRFAKRGSKILLITRMQSVADMAADVVGGDAECLKLDELDEHSNFVLFKSQLTHHINSEDHSDLLLVGEQIAQKIGGCLILTLAIATELRDNLRANYWHTVLEGDMLQIRGMHGILVALQLSYDRLPAQLQVCFRYCAMLPSGHTFNKQELINMWVGSGLIPFASSKPGDICLPFASLKLEDIGSPRTENVSLLNPEDVGQQCFTALTRKSFFCHVLERDPSNGDQNEYYVLHNLMHVLAQLVSRGECARVQKGGIGFFQRNHSSYAHT